MDPVTLWVEYLRSSYLLWFGERMNELTDVKVRFFDARGLHPAPLDALPERTPTRHSLPSSGR
jgi:hypothetical protein